MANARDRATARRILDVNLPRFADAQEQLRNAYLARVSELYEPGTTLADDVNTSMELAALMLGRPFNPESRNRRQMPEMVRRHGPVEALKRLVENAGPRGTDFFQACVKAGNLTYTAEAIVLRNRELFSDLTVARASERLGGYPSLSRRTDPS
jgi:hypothetical protein